MNSAKIFQFRFTHLEMLDLQRAHRVGGHDLLLDQLHLYNAIGLDTILGPIHVALAPATLHQIGNHHNDRHTLFPDHAPEAIEGIGQRSLGANERMRLLIAIDKVGINVVQILLLSWRRMQVYAAVIVYRKKDQYN